MAKIAVVGAGITGLAAAHALVAAGHDVVVLERSGFLGGRARSERMGGFLIEHGPNGIVGPAQAADGLIERLGLARSRVERQQAARRRYLVRGGRPWALGLSPAALLFSSYLSLGGRLRLIAEPLVPRGGHDGETIAAFVRRRFGRQFLDHVMEPLVGGLFAGDPERLGVAAAFPQLTRMERESGSVVRSVIAARIRGGLKPSAFHPRNRRLFSFRDGLGTLPRTLATALGERIHRGCHVVSVEAARGGGFDVSLRQDDDAARIRVDGVVVATPAYDAAVIAESLDSKAAEALRAIVHPPLAVVFLGYDAACVRHPLDGVGVLAPRVERRSVLGFLFSSTLFPDRAPSGCVALTAYVGGQRQPALARLPHDDLVDLVHREARDLLSVSGQPMIVKTQFWPRSLPQLAPDHGRRVADLRALEERFPGLVFAGNYLAGASIAACIGMAEAKAQRVCETLMASSACRTSVAA